MNLKRKKIIIVFLASVALSIELGLIYGLDIFVQADKRIPLPAAQFLPEPSQVETDFFLYLYIDKLSISVPVVADVNASDKEIYFASLQNGVAHMAGTPKPDQEGNVVIFGHSNFYANDPGAYKKIFENLDQLEAEDKISVKYKDQSYGYQVVKQELVKPRDTWVLTADYDLTLITCWPPGSIEKRLIVFANKL